MTKPGQGAQEDSRKDAAVSWFLRRSIAPLSAEEQTDFESWLAGSPENREAFLEVEEFWAGSAQLEELPRFDGKRHAILRSVERSSLVRKAGLGVLAALFIAAASGVGLQGFQWPRPLADQSFRTAVGQQATVTLPDGSVVTLNTDTVIRTKEDADQRLVFLDKGQAFFRVTKDRRHPFVVAAGGRTVTALGTSFDVRVDGAALRVVLVEGKVRVEGRTIARPASSTPGDPTRPASATTDTRATEMEAGSELVARDESDWRLSRTDVVSATSWTHGKLVFDDERLGDVVAELNRYSQRRIVVTDADLAAVRISGVYRPNDLDGLAFGLRNTGVAELQQNAGGEVRIVALK